MFNILLLTALYNLLTPLADQDVYSYDVEQSRGQAGNNIVTLLMNENETSLQETVDYIGDYCKELVEKYISAKRQLSPSLGKAAADYIDVLGHWMIGNLV